MVFRRFMVSRICLADVNLGFAFELGADPTGQEVRPSPTPDCDPSS